MYDALAQHSFALRHWFLYFLWLLFTFGGCGIGLATVRRSYKNQKEKPEPIWHKRWYSDLAILGLAIIFACIAFRSDIKNIEKAVNENDPMFCDLSLDAQVRMVQTLQWSRNQEGVKINGCNLHSGLKVVAEQHVKGAVTINPAVSFDILSERQIVIHVNRTDWKGFQDGEIVVSIIDPNKSPSWRGSIAELRAGAIGGGRQLITLSTR